MLMIRIEESVNSILDVVSRRMLQIQVRRFLVGHKRIPGCCCMLKRGDWEGENLGEYLFVLRLGWQCIVY